MGKSKLKRLKKAVAAAAAFSLLAGLLAGCGGSNGSKAASVSAASEQSAEVSVSASEEEISEVSYEESKAETSEVSYEESELDTSADSSQAEESEADATSFHEFVAADNDNYTIKVVEFDPESSFYGYSVTFELTNKSSSQTYGFSIEDASVNGVVITEIMGLAKVEAGDTEESETGFDVSTFQSIGMGDVTDIRFHITVENENDEVIGDEEFHVYPLGKANATKFEREPQEDDDDLFDDGDVSVRGIGWLYYEGMPVFLQYFYVENKTDTTISVHGYHETLNGKECDMYFYGEVTPHESGIITASWYVEDMEAAGITVDDLTEIKFTLSVSKSEARGDYVTKEVTIPIIH